MTNLEKIKSMDEYELASFICDHYDAKCFACPGEKFCEMYKGPGNGLRVWLQKEADNDER